MNKKIRWLSIGICILFTIGAFSSALPVNTFDTDLNQYGIKQILLGDQLDQYSEKSDNSTEIHGGAAQSFKPTLPKLTRVEIALSKGPYYLEYERYYLAIKEDSPSGNVLTQTFLSRSEFNWYGGIRWIEYDITDINVIPGVTYYIVVWGDTSTGDTGTLYLWYGYPDPYPDGDAYYYIMNNWVKMQVSGQDCDFCFRTYGEANNPPNKPATPSGPTSGKAGTSYTYFSSAIDPDGDQIYLLFDWNDGTDSGWLGPYNSGDLVSASHIWSAQGTYAIKVKAKDELGKLSIWSDPLPISMPKTYDNPLKPLSEKMSICHIVSTGTGNFKILSGAIIHGLAGISAFSIDLENDGYTTISSLFNPDYRFTITGNQRIIIIGYTGYFTWESKENNAILSVNGVALIATVTQTS